MLSEKEVTMRLVKEVVMQFVKEVSLTSLFNWVAIRALIIVMTLFPFTGEPNSSKASAFEMMISSPTDGDILITSTGHSSGWFFQKPGVLGSQVGGGQGGGGQGSHACTGITENSDSRGSTDSRSSIETVLIFKTYPPLKPNLIHKSNKIL